MPSKGTVWAGRIITTLVILFLIFDMSIKLFRHPAAVAGTIDLGYHENMVQVIGIILLVCFVFYVIPRTAVLGAILLTGYLGGAIASQVRTGKPLFNDLFAFCFAVLVWLGIYLRDARLRTLVPLRSSEPDDSRKAATEN